MTIFEVNRYVAETYGDNYSVQQRANDFALFNDDSPFKFPDTAFSCEMSALKEAIDQYFDKD